MDELKVRSFDEIKAIAHTLGKGTIAKYADEVDTAARFPSEAFSAFKENHLLSAFIPSEYGGDGLSLTEISELCRIFGTYCGSTAMIFAMHQIQVACIVHHSKGSEYFQKFMETIHENQLLLASATTEIGVGGDLRSSICCAQIDGGTFTVEKKAPVISYALDADAILVTCRANSEAPASDQVQVILNKGQYSLEPISGWDTMGFRGTCSSGFVIKGTAPIEQIMPAPFAQILAQSMHPVSHLTWGSLWTGLAQGAVNKARQSVRDMVRRSNELPQITATRLAELDEVLFSMKGGLQTAVTEYQAILDSGNLYQTEKYGFSIQINNVKTRCSELVVDVVGKALLIVGIGGYRNDGKYSLCRDLRDAYGAALMVNNDRIRGHNATMQIAIKES